LKSKRIMEWPPRLSASGETGNFNLRWNPSHHVMSQPRGYCGGDTRGREISGEATQPRAANRNQVDLDELVTVAA
jgi:hypothetical protein